MCVTSDPNLKKWGLSKYFTTLPQVEPVAIHIQPHRGWRVPWTRVVFGKSIILDTSTLKGLNVNSLNGTLGIRGANHIDVICEPTETSVPPHG
ncbi:MAG: hypothetical protein DRR19_21335 [Candidatus Parabeggiatoa sp. nov. 1]|nr:MAG: hypothetical protein DRR19_21335 [Gammaproteobacteria bacterium]